MEATLNDIQISDLFFNHENTNLQSIYGGEVPPSDEEFNEALLADAKVFSELLNGDVSPQDLVNDYKKRL